MKIKWKRRIRYQNVLCKSTGLKQPTSMQRAANLEFKYARM